MRMNRRDFVGAAGAGIAMTAFGSATSRPAHAAPAPVRRQPNGLPDSRTITETDPALLSAVEAASLLQSRQLHPVELLDACLARSRAHDGATTAWIRIYPDVGREHAEQAAQRLSAAHVAANGPAPAICGLPIGVKDLFAVAGLPLTASSRVLEGNIAAGDCTVWRHLREAGAVLIGHTHMNEFALGATTPQVGNPWDPTRSAGGSSGGSAAVLAARFAPLALGTDTGGSLRIPASKCGISAIKPTSGRCSKYGVIPGVPTRDHVGPMARSVADAALMLGYLARGVDPNDPVTAMAPPVPPDGFLMAAVPGAAPLQGKRFGVYGSDADGVPEEIGRLFADFLRLVQSLGGELVDIELPSPPAGLLTNDLMEVGAYHRQFAGQLDRYGADVADAAALGVASLATPVDDYWTFQTDRAAYQRAYNRLFAQHSLDAILMPGVRDDGTARNEAGSYTDLILWANYTGAPVVTLPVGRSARTGMPFGVQLGGLPWDETALIEIAVTMQAAEDSWREVPPVPALARDIPAVQPTTPGAGPDPTNTVAGLPAVRFVPTTSTALP